MSSIQALMALGMSAELAKRAGYSCGTVAATGSAATDAAIAKRICLVTGADATKGVKAEATAEAGDIYIIKNVANAVLKVYCESGDYVYIAGTATPQDGATAISIAAYYTLLLAKVDDTSWIALEIVGA